MFTGSNFRNGFFSLRAEAAVVKNEQKPFEILETLVDFTPSFSKDCVQARNSGKISGGGGGGAMAAFLYPDPSQLKRNNVSV